MIKSNINSRNEDWESLCANMNSRECLDSFGTTSRHLPNSTNVPFDRYPLVLPNESKHTRGFISVWYFEIQNVEIKKN